MLRDGIRRAPVAAHVTQRGPVPPRSLSERRPGCAYRVIKKAEKAVPAKVQKCGCWHPSCDNLECKDKWKEGMDNRKVSQPKPKPKPKRKPKANKASRSKGTYYSPQSMFSAIMAMTLFFLIGLTPKVTAGYTPGGSPFFRRVAHLGTFVNDQLGVVIDPQGLAMHSADTVHLPVVIHLALPEWSSLQIPDLSTAYCPPFEPNGSCRSDCCSNGTCTAFPIISQQIDNIRREMKESYQGILDTRYYAGLMKSYCQENPTLCDQSPRSKRMILPILATIGTLFGLTGVGMGMHQSWQIDGMQTKMRALHDVVASNQETVFQQGQIITELTKANENTYSFLHHALRDVVAMVEQVRCADVQYTSMVHQQLIAHIFSANVRSTIRAMMSALLHGEISPELIDVTMLRHLFVRHPRLSDSVILREPSLVYQFGRVFPVRIDLDSFRFAFILEVPVPAEPDLVPYFRVLNLGWNDPQNAAHVRLPLPQYVVRKGDDTFETLNMELCKQKPGMIYCSPNAYEYNELSHCLKWVLQANLTDPKIIGKCKTTLVVAPFVNKTMVMSSTAGILVLSPEPEIIVSTHSAVNQLRTGATRANSPNGVTWFPHGNYTGLIIGSTVITSSLQPAEYHVKIGSELEPISIPPLKFKPLTWSTLEDAKNANLQVEQIARQAVKQLRHPLNNTWNGFTFTQWGIILIGICITAAVAMYMLAKCLPHPRIISSRVGTWLLNCPRTRRPATPEPSRSYVVPRYGVGGELETVSIRSSSSGFETILLDSAESNRQNSNSTDKDGNATINGFDRGSSLRSTLPARAGQGLTNRLRYDTEEIRPFVRFTKDPTAPVREGSEDLFAPDTPTQTRRRNTRSQSTQPPEHIALVEKPRAQSRVTNQNQKQLIRDIRNLMEGPSEADKSAQINKQTPLLTNGRTTTRAHSASSEEMENFPSTSRQLNVITRSPNLTVTPTPLVATFRVAGKMTLSLIDTGADITVVSRGLAEHAGIPPDSQEVHPRVFTASNHELPILGKARIPFELGPHLVMHEVFIVDTPPYHAILGTDILRKCGSLTIDFSEKHVDFTDPLSDDITRVPMAKQDIG